jgi:multiple sugar transport system ATP-binding protein
MAGLLLSGIRKSFGRHAILHGFDLEVGDGEFVVLVGPSGCGKTTTLRIVAGLDAPDEGVVRIGGRDVTALAPSERNIAMVFQNYAVYPHMSVRRNIGFGLRAARLDAGERERRILATARVLGLGEQLDRRPAQLSGGQRQRVAIGRAMVRDPSVFLFDEPLSNLDAQLRGELRLEIKKLHRRLGATMMFVTHDQVEAMTLADRVVVMHQGQVMQIGSPREIYDRPANLFTARFVGGTPMNLLPARIGPDASVLLDGIAASLRVPAGAGCRRDSTVVLGVRPEDIAIGGGEAIDGLVLDGTVSALEPLGAETLVHVEAGGASLVGRVSGRRLLAIGEKVRMQAPCSVLHLFDASTGEAIRS